MYKNAHLIIGVLFIFSLALFSFGLNLKHKNSTLPTPENQVKEFEKLMETAESENTFKKTPNEETGEGETFYYLANAYGTDDGYFFVVLDEVKQVLDTTGNISYQNENPLYVTNEFTSDALIKIVDENGIQIEAINTPKDFIDAYSEADNYYKIMESPYKLNIENNMVSSLEQVYIP